MRFCRTYWGSHGCVRERGHEGDHHCHCCTCPSNQSGETGTFILHESSCVAYAPYYGPATRFFGEDGK